MASKKRLIKAIKSFEKQITRHRRKIAEYSGKNSFLKDYREKEIRNYENQKKKKIN